MILVGKLARRADPYALNAVQLSAIFVLAVPTAFLLEGQPPSLASLAPSGLMLALSFGFLAVFSTVIAFTAQIVGQRHASASTSSVIMLLETPIGVVAAMFILHETMTFGQWCGAGLLLTGIGVSLRGERPAPLEPEPSVVTT
jgi:drug/metabolite transporter (DMT)-like permease